MNEWKEDAVATTEFLLFCKVLVVGFMKDYFSSYNEGNMIKKKSTWIIIGCMIIYTFFITDTLLALIDRSNLSALPI